MSLYNPQYKDGQGNIVDLPINAKKLDGYSYNEYSKYYTTSSTTANAFLVTIPYVKALSDGLVIHCKFHTATKSGATLNVNNLGAKGIYYGSTTAITTQIVENNYVELVYSSEIDKWVMSSSYDETTNKCVKYSEAQNLTDAQKKQARDNISAVSTNKDETISGLKTFAAPTNKAGTEQATVWFNTANGGRVGFGKEGANSGTGIFFDQVSGTRRLKFRASATPGAMVWEQPESGSCLYYDVDSVQFRGCNSILFNNFKSAGYLYTDSNGSLKKGTLSKVATSGSYNDLSNKPTIPVVPTNISEFTNDSGYITGITSSMVTTALGYTPGKVTKVNNTSPDSSGNVSITLPTKSSWNYDDRYVRFDTYQQGLTELEQIYARINIGAGTSSFSGSYNDLDDKPYECIKPAPIYTTDNSSKYIFLWGLKEDTHTLYFVPEGNYFVYARGTNLSDRDGNVGTFFGPGVLFIHNMGSNELRYTYYEGYSQEIKYGSVHSHPSSTSPDYYECSPIVKGNFEAQTGTPATPLYIKYTSPTYTDGATYEFAECSVYAGGTNVTLNGTNKSANTASFYAPESAGTSGQFLKSSGANASPTWETVTIPTKSSWNYDDAYVKYTASQSLTDAQKTQARTNIGAGTSNLAIGTTSSTAAAGNHTHSTTLSTDSGTPTVTMAPNTTYKLSTGGTNVVFKTPSDAYKILEYLRKGSEADTAVGYYKIATINHASWNFCDFCMLVKNSYSGTAYSTIFNCSCSDSNVKLQDFKLNIISGTNISNKLAYLYTYDSSNNLIKIEIFIHCTRVEHPIFYIINARPGQQLVLPTQDEFDKATPDKPDGTAMTGNATYAPVSGGTNGQLLSTNGSSLVWVNDNRSLLHHDLAKTIENTTTDKGWKMFNDTYDGFLLKSLRFQSKSPSWGVGDFGSGIVFGGADTKGVMSLSYGKPQIKFAGGNGTGPTWWIGLTGTSGASYNLDNLKYAPTTAGTSGYSLKSNGSGAPRWANEAKVQVSGTISTGVKNNDSITLVITNTSKPLKKGVWRYSGTHGVFLIFATNEITTMGSPRTAYICGYVSSQISNNTSLTLVEV